MWIIDIITWYQPYWQFNLRHFTKPLPTLANYCSKRAPWRRAPPMSCLLQPPTAKMYLDRKLDIRRIIFFTSYRNGNIASTNMSANVENWYFLVATGSEMKPLSHARIPVALATAKFSGEIYHAACTGKCRGPVARFVVKIFTAALSMFSSRDACVHHGRDIDALCPASIREDHTWAYTRTHTVYISVLSYDDGVGVSHCQVYLHCFSDE